MRRSYRSGSSSSSTRSRSPCSKSRRRRRTSSSPCSKSRRRRTRSRSPDSTTDKIKKKFQEEHPNRRCIKKDDPPLPKMDSSGQTESFLAELASTMDLPLTPRQQEQRELWEPPLPPEVLALIKEDECRICNYLHLTSEAVAKSHYHGSKHEKMLLKMLVDKGGEVPKKKGCNAAENLMSPQRCDLCMVDLNGAYNANLHYTGVKHQKRLHMFNVNKMAQFNMEVESEKSQPTPMMDNNFGLPEAAMEEAGMMEEVNPFFCNVCNINCQNQGPFEVHLMGMPHAKKVKAQEREGILFCDICQIHSSASDMKAHLSSKKHQSRVIGLNQDLGLFSCEICGIGCSDQNSLDSHLRGQKHAKKALRLARDNTDLDGQNQSPLKAYLEGTPTPTSKFIKGNGMFSCKICGIGCSDQSSLDAHLNGQKHAKICERLGRENIDLVQLLESQSQSPLEEHFKGKPDDAKKVKAPEGDRSLFCDICQVRCPCLDNMKEHLASKRHQSQVNGMERALGMFRCDICGIKSSDQKDLDNHLSGLKHRKIMLKMARASTDFYAKG